METHSSHIHVIGSLQMNLRQYARTKEESEHFRTSHQREKDVTVKNLANCEGNLARGGVPLSDAADPRRLAEAVRRGTRVS